MSSWFKKFLRHLRNPREATAIVNAPRVDNWEEPTLERETFPRVIWEDEAALKQVKHWQPVLDWSRT